MESKKETKKYKHSRQRERILEVLRSTKSHPTAAWVYNELKPAMPHLSLGTVYRNLRILGEQGEILILQNGSGPDRFDGDTKPHYHYICLRCGRVEDVPLPVNAELDAQAASVLNRPVLGHRLDFLGFCADCMGQKD